MNTPLLTLLALVGIALPVPHVAPVQDRAPARQAGEQGSGEQADPEQVALAATYFRIADYDGNGWISYREARESLGTDRRRFSVYDENRDGRITLEEFTKVFLGTLDKLGAFPPPKPDPDDPDAPTLSEILSEKDEPGETEAVETPKPTSVLELLGKVIPRGKNDLGQPQPGQIAGPVPSFHRLDYDGDGGISMENLVLLTKGSGLDLRLNTLLASLDGNGNGVIDRSEFQASMRGARD